MALRPWCASSFGKGARPSALRGGVRHGVRPALTAYGLFSAAHRVSPKCGAALRLLAPSARALVPGGRGSAPPECTVCETASAGTAPAKAGFLRSATEGVPASPGLKPPVRPAIKTPLDGAPPRTRCHKDKCGFRGGDKHRFFCAAPLSPLPARGERSDRTAGKFTQ